MFGMMGETRVNVQAPSGYDYIKIRDSSVWGQQPDVSAIAARGTHNASVMVWNYHDNNNTDVPASSVNVTIKGLPSGKVLLHHYRIDEEHSNSYALWKKMGSPQNPGASQIVELEKAGQLQLLASPEWIKTTGGEYSIKMQLPRQGVSLIRFSG